MRRPVRKLGRNQKRVLEIFTQYGWWQEGCDWHWGDNQDRVFESLVKRGLLKKIPLATSPWEQKYRFELTDEGAREASHRGVTPVHLKFGYAVLKEKDEIRERLIAAGMTDLRELHFAVAAAYTEAHKNDKTMKDRQEEARQRAAAKSREQERPQPSYPIRLSAEELAYLAEHFEQANNPIGAAIGEKANATLKTIA